MFTVLHTEASTGWGGQEIRIYQESLGMIKRGHKVVIVAPRDSTILKMANEAGIKTIQADFKKNPFSILRLQAIINAERPDILNTHSSSDSWAATIAARLSRIRPKIIRTRHISAPIGKSFLSRLIYDILTDAVITTGEEIRQMMINYNGFNDSKIVSIPTGIDIERFNPKKVKPALKKKGFSVGMISVLRKWKGHRYFIEAIPKIIKEIPNSVFYIVGDGPQLENIKDLIQRSLLEDRVLMLGYREDIPEILASLDVVVHPSYANEGVPQSILQALAMERAVVASNIGAINEIVIDGRTGFLIRSKNPREIAEKVIELYKRPDLRIKFGVEGRKLVERGYSLEDMIIKVENLYRRLLTGERI